MFLGWRGRFLIQTRMNLNLRSRPCAVLSHHRSAQLLCCKVADLEAHTGQGPSDLLKDELSQSLEELEALLKAKDEVGTEPATSHVFFVITRRIQLTVFLFF